MGWGGEAGAAGDGCYFGMALYKVPFFWTYTLSETLHRLEHETLGQSAGERKSASFERTPLTAFAACARWGFPGRPAVLSTRARVPLNSRPVRRCCK